MKLRSHLPHLLCALSLFACNKREPEPTASQPATIPSAPAAEATPSAAPAAAEPTAAPAESAPPAAPAAADPKTIPAPEDVAQAPKDAKKTKTGLQSKVLSPGKGKDHPTDADKVKVHYTGWTTDGKMFDSSVARGEPTSFAVTQVIPGWTEGLKLMVAGEKRRFWIPAALAYGEKPMPGMPAGALTFDVELIDIVAQPKTPEDVAAAPATAKKTKSGIAYRVLKAGTGKTHPTATSTVTVHYSGWTLDGKMFDSSVVRGEPTSFGLNQVIPGWTEGVQLMVEGEKTRFWIPGNMAYGDKAAGGRPSGTLVFDIELLQIK